MRNRVLALASVLVALGWASAAQAQYLLTPGPTSAPTGGALQIGTGLPLPVGTAGIFFGGMTPGTAGTFPPLGIGINPAAGTISQTGGTGQGGAIVIPSSVLTFQGDGIRNAIGVFPTNPAVFQVATSLNYAWPAASATLAPGGAPGPASHVAAGGIITYSGGTKSFGGPARFALAPGPGAGTHRIPPNTLGATPIASVWINFAGAAPTTAMTLGIVGASNPVGLAQPGAAVGSPQGTTMFGPVNPGFGAVNQPVGGTGCTMFCVGPLGTVPSSAAVGGPFASNMVTSSKGFPFSTGFVTISQPGAVPPEVFFLSGTDMRVAGVGNISLVAGSLSLRALSGPNANRAWVSLNLPEPGVALGAAGALGMLALLHGVVRRRSR